MDYFPALAALATVSTNGIDLAQPPVEMRANQDAAWAMVIICLVGCAMAIGWAIHGWVKERNVIVPALMLGGVALAFVEPLFDAFHGVWYPADIPLQAATAFGRGISWGIVAAYIFFFSVTTYGAYLLMRRGCPLKHLLLYAALFAVIDSIMEMGATELDVFAWYAYDGENAAAILGLPLYMIAWNGLYAVLSGALLFHAMPYLTGFRALLLVPGVVVIYGGGISLFAAPALIALNNPVDDWVMWATGIVSAAVMIAVSFWAATLPAIAALRDPVPGTAPLARPATILEGR